jgi:hypothetical protein
MKEDDEGILFRTLLTAKMHRGNRISRGKGWRRSAHLFWAAALVPVLVALVWGWHRGEHGSQRRARRAQGRKERRRCRWYPVVAALPVIFGGSGYSAPAQQREEQAQVQGKKSGRARRVGGERASCRGRAGRLEKRGVLAAHAREQERNGRGPGRRRRLCRNTRRKHEAERCETRVTRARFIGTRRHEVWQVGGREGSRGGCAACRWAPGRGIRLWAETVSAMGRELNLGWPSRFVWCWPGTPNWAAERRKIRGGGTAPAQTDGLVEKED